MKRINIATIFALFLASGVGYLYYAFPPPSLPPFAITSVLVFMWAISPIVIAICWVLMVMREARK